jgi:hypothetical protein
MKRLNLLRVSFKPSGLEEAQQSMYARLGTLRSRWLEMFQEERRELLKALREEAPKDTGEFERGIHVSLYERGGMTHLDAYVTGPHAYLLPWIVNGTRGHEIPTGGAAAQMAKGYPLKFYWENGPNGPGVYAYWSVWHPGTRPNRFPSRALRRRKPDLYMNLQRVGAEVAEVKVYKGGKARGRFTAGLV